MPSPKTEISSSLWSVYKMELQWQLIKQQKKKKAEINNGSAQNRDSAAAPPQHVLHTVINSSWYPKFQQSFQHAQVPSENEAFVKGERNFKLRLQWWLKTKAEGALVKDPCHGLITIIICQWMEIKGIIVLIENCSISASWDSLSPACSLLILKKKNTLCNHNCSYSRANSFLSPL